MCCIPSIPPGLGHVTRCVLQRAQDVEVWCRVLPCAAVRKSVLLCVAMYCSLLSCVAVRCSVLLCVAVYCSLLQYVAFPKYINNSRAGPYQRHVISNIGTCWSRQLSPETRQVCCSVLQCVAVCCSVCVL